MIFGLSGTINELNSIDVRLCVGTDPYLKIINQSILFTHEPSIYQSNQFWFIYTIYVTPMMTPKFLSPIQPINLYRSI